ncbi:thiamine ABC transporter substrate-binding protein [Desulfoluna limicola]|uniref:Thiamine ABC transporter substrate-binding protein n=1 Tax=Desulfoluna limicola TaxID=2810562 RepID=A0ABN6F490_9BACT|nr:thiamine ABC transporter substrate binding subunit [Desulfoluna limicola]BCS97253.1 thiamine ABC transporter substrate-binding protein [Desulfoluna limicola]
MMKRLMLAVMCLCLAGLPAYAAAGKTDEKLVVYTYDSFASEWGLAPKVIPAFEEMSGIKVELISVGSSGQVLQRAMLEKENPKADVVIGIDNNLLAKAKKAGVLSPYRSKGLDNVPEALRFDPEYQVTPFDYGYFAMIYDSEIIKNPPKSLEDLTSDAYKKSVILMDPRTSGPGLGFLLWTVSAYGDDFADYWKRLTPSILTITDSWSSGYGLFTNGEAPIVLSYSSSPVYHVAFEKSDRYKAAAFEGGHYMQIEGAGIVKGAPHRKAAEAFIDFMLSDTFQKEIPLTNIMFPTNSATSLPESFSHAVKPEKSLQLLPGEIMEKNEGWISTWVDTVSK